MPGGRIRGEFEGSRLLQHASDPPTAPTPEGGSWAIAGGQTPAVCRSDLAGRPPQPCPGSDPARPVLSGGQTPAVARSTRGSGPPAGVSGVRPCRHPEGAACESRKGLRYPALDPEKWPSG